MSLTLATIHKCPFCQHPLCERNAIRLGTPERFIFICHQCGKPTLVACEICFRAVQYRPVRPYLRCTEKFDQDKIFGEIVGRNADFLLDLFREKEE